MAGWLALRLWLAAVGQVSPLGRLCSAYLVYDDVGPQHEQLYGNGWACLAGLGSHLALSVVEVSWGWEEGGAARRVRRWREGQGASLREGWGPRAGDVGGGRRGWLGSSLQLPQPAFPTCCRSTAAVSLRLPFGAAHPHLVS